MTALIVGGVVVALAAVAFLGSQLLGGDDPVATAPNEVTDRPAPSTEETATAGSGGGSLAEGRSGATVAVLNGTTTTGLAQSVQERLVSAGYPEEGTVDTAPDQTRQTSTVYYAEGERRQAGDVARLLDIGDLQRMDADTQDLAGEGTRLLVIAGADKAPNP